MDMLFKKIFEDAKTKRYTHYERSPLSEISTSTITTRPLAASQPELNITAFGRLIIMSGNITPHKKSAGRRQAISSILLSVPCKQRERRKRGKGKGKGKGSSKVNAQVKVQRAQCAAKRGVKAKSAKSAKSVSMRLPARQKVSLPSQKLLKA